MTAIHGVFFAAELFRQIFWCGTSLAFLRHVYRWEKSNAGKIHRSLGATGARPDRHDGDLQSAICVDAFREAVARRDRRVPAGLADHLLALDRAANLALARAGLAR